MVVHFSYTHDLNLMRNACKFHSESVSDNALVSFEYIHDDIIMIYVLPCGRRRTPSECFQITNEIIRLKLHYTFDLACMKYEYLTFRNQ